MHLCDTMRGENNQHAWRLLLLLLLLLLLFVVVVAPLFWRCCCWSCVLCFVSVAFTQLAFGLVAVPPWM